MGAVWELPNPAQLLTHIILAIGGVPPMCTSQILLDCRTTKYVVWYLKIYVTQLNERQ